MSDCMLQSRAIVRFLFTGFLSRAFCSPFSRHQHSLSTRTTTGRGCRLTRTGTILRHPSLHRLHSPSKTLLDPLSMRLFFCSDSMESFTCTSTCTPFAPVMMAPGNEFCPSPVSFPFVLAPFWIYVWMGYTQWVESPSSSTSTCSDTST
jgi:hypothetical protein